MSEAFFFVVKQKTAYEMLRSLVGSEMCIRDSSDDRAAGRRVHGTELHVDRKLVPVGMKAAQVQPCLLYTSDAADDLLCVDPGGRRIIKQKHVDDVRLRSLA